MAVRFVYHLTCPKGNHDLMLNNARFMTALVRARDYPSEAHLLYLSLAEINLRGGVFGGNALARGEQHTNFEILQGSFESAEMNPNEEEQTLLALRRLCEVSDDTREAMWALFNTQTGGVAKHTLLPRTLHALERAMAQKLAVAVEDGLLALVQLAGDVGPREAMRRSGSTLAPLLERASTLAVPAVSQAVSQLKLRLVDEKEAAAAAQVKRAEEMAQAARLVLGAHHRMFTDTAVLSYAQKGQWDQFVAHLTGEGDVSQMLGLALSCRAPLQVVEFLVRTKHADVNERYLFAAAAPLLCGGTPLELALRSESADVALFLLNSDADTSFTSEDQYTPLMLSCESHKLVPVTLRLLLKGNLDYQSPAVGKYCMTALGVCIVKQPRGLGYEQARLVLEAGASPNVSFDEKTRRRRLPYYFCMTQQQAPMLKLLREHGADASCAAEYATAYFEMVRNSIITKPDADTQLEILEMLRGAAADGGNAIASSDLFALFYARKSAARAVTLRWLELGGGGLDPTLAMEDAAKRGATQDVALFLQVGVDPNHHNTCPLVYAIATEDVATSRLLIRAGADVGKASAVAHRVFAGFDAAKYAAAKRTLAKAVREEKESGGGGEGSGEGWDLRLPCARTAAAT